MLAYFSKTAKARKQTEDWYRLAEKVRDFRRDVLEPAQLTALEELLERLRGLRKDRKAPVETHHEAAEAADAVLRNCGGVFYPRGFWAENIETVLVVAILAIGFRTFFLQPFEIPTNSMYPTYNGLTSTLVEPGEQKGTALRVFDKVVRGTTHFQTVAPASGELLLPVSVQSPVLDPDMPGKLPYLHFRLFDRAPARPYLPVMRGMADTYYQFVGSTEVPVKLPADFDYDRLMRQWLKQHAVNPRLTTVNFKGRNLYAVATGVQVQSGRPMVAFEVHKGDMLFVDRFSYHWVAPQVGAPFVFRTDEIAGMGPGEDSKYYIKRLVGQGGDVLEIRPPELLRNGAPITGSEAFDNNNHKVGEYEGYIRFPKNGHSLYPGDEPINVPPDHFFAMGDNSDQSSDSRVWGFVPKTSVLGRAVFIFYPFGPHWGPSH